MRKYRAKYRFTRNSQINLIKNRKGFEHGTGDRVIDERFKLKNFLKTTLPNHQSSIVFSTMNHRIFARKFRCWNLRAFWSRP